MQAGSVELLNGRTLQLEIRQIGAFQAEADKAIADLKGEVPKADETAEIPAEVPQAEVK